MKLSGWRVSLFNVLPRSCKQKTLFVSIVGFALSCRVRCFAIPFKVQHYTINEQGENMKNPLDSIPGTIVSGLILTVVLYFFVKNFLAAGV